MDSADQTVALVLDVLTAARAVTAHDRTIFGGVRFCSMTCT